MNTLLLTLLGLGIVAVCVLCLGVVVAIASEANDTNRWMQNGRNKKS